MKFQFALPFGTYLFHFNTPKVWPLFECARAGAPEGEWTIRLFCWALIRFNIGIHVAGEKGILIARLPLPEEIERG